MVSLIRVRRQRFSRKAWHRYDIGIPALSTGSRKNHYALYEQLYPLDVLILTLIRRASPTFEGYVYV